MRHLDIRPGLYRDSVRLMQISSALAARPGVTSALVAMATGVNLEMLSGMGFDPPDGASPNDMLIALVTDDESATAAALDALDAELASGGAPAGSGGTSGGEPIGADVVRQLRERGHEVVVGGPWSLGRMSWPAPPWRWSPRPVGTPSSKPWTRSTPARR